jgi:hypothetical protein
VVLEAVLLYAQRAGAVSGGRRRPERNGREGLLVMGIGPEVIGAFGKFATEVPDDLVPEGWRERAYSAAGMVRPERAPELQLDVIRLEDLRSEDLRSVPTQGSSPTTTADESATGARTRERSTSSRDSYAARMGSRRPRAADRHGLVLQSRSAEARSRAFCPRAKKNVKDCIDVLDTRSGIV